MKKQIWMRLVLGAALVGGVALVASAPANADPDYSNSCHQRLNSDKARIDHDAHRHGNNSPQVNHDVDRMDRDRQWCRDHHSDWDHSSFDVGIYFRP